MALVTASCAKVIHGTVIDGEVAHRGTVLGGHVRNSCSIGEGQIPDTRAEELDELADDTALAEHLDDSEDEIGGGGSLSQLTMEVEADDLGKDHGDGLAEHDSLSLDTTNTPSGDAKTVDHSRVRVGTDDGVGVEEVVSVEHDAGEVLKVDLMDDTRARRHDLEVIESLGSPLEELEAFAVTEELELLVLFAGISNTSGIDGDGVINDKIDGAERVDLRGIATETLHGVTHGSEINDSGYASEVLEDDTRWAERNLGVVLRGLFPVEDCLNVGLLHAEVVAVANVALEEDADGVRQAR